jgi:hypothetical protein
MKKLLLMAALLLITLVVQAQESVPDRWIVSGSIAFDIRSTPQTVTNQFGEEYSRWDDQTIGLNVLPAVYRRVSDRWWLGVELGAGFRQSTYEQEDVSFVIIDGVSQPVVDSIAVVTASWNTGGRLLARYQVQATNRVAFFLEPFLRANFQQSKSEINTQLEPQVISRVNQGWQAAIGVRPGIAVQVAPQWWLAGRFGVGAIRTEWSRKADEPWPTAVLDAELEFNLPSTQIGVEYRW